MTNTSSSNRAIAVSFIALSLAVAEGGGAFAQAPGTPATSAAPAYTPGATPAGTTPYQTTTPTTAPSPAYRTPGSPTPASGAMTNCGTPGPITTTQTNASAPSAGRTSGIGPTQSMSNVTTAASASPGASSLGCTPGMATPPASSYPVSPSTGP